MYQENIVSIIVYIVILLIFVPFGAAGSVYSIYRFVKKRQRLRQFVVEFHTAGLNSVASFVYVPLQTCLYLLPLFGVNIPAYFDLAVSICLRCLQIVLITLVGIITVKRVKTVTRKNRPSRSSGVITLVSLLVPWALGLTIGIPTTVFQIKRADTHLNVSKQLVYQTHTCITKSSTYEAIYIGLLLTVSIIMLAAYLAVRRHIHSAIGFSDGNNNLVDKITTIEALVKSLGENLAVQFVTGNGRLKTVISEPFHVPEGSIAASRVVVDNWIEEKPTREKYKSMDKSSSNASGISSRNSGPQAESNSLSLNGGHISSPPKHIPSKQQGQSFETIEEEGLQVKEDIEVLSEDEIAEELRAEFCSNTEGLRWPKRTQHSHTSSYISSDQGKSSFISLTWADRECNDSTAQNDCHATCFRNSSDSNSVQCVNLDIPEINKNSPESVCNGFASSKQVNSEMKQYIFKRGQHFRQNVNAQSESHSNNKSATLSAQGLALRSPTGRTICRTFSTDDGDDSSRDDSQTEVKMSGSRNDIKSQSPTLSGSKFDFLNPSRASSTSQKTWSKNSNASSSSLPPLRHTRREPSSASFRSGTPLSRFSINTTFSVFSCYDEDIFSLSTLSNGSGISSGSNIGNTGLISERSKQSSRNETGKECSEVQYRTNIDEGELTIVNTVSQPIARSEPVPNESLESSSLCTNSQKVLEGIPDPSYPSPTCDKMDDQPIPVDIRITRPSTEAERCLQRKNGQAGGRSTKEDPLSFGPTSSKPDPLPPTPASKSSISTSRTKETRFSQSAICCEGGSATRQQTSIPLPENRFRRKRFKYHFSVLRRFLLAFVINIVTQLPCSLLELVCVDGGEPIYAHLRPVFLSLSLTSFCLTPYLYVLGNKSIHGIITDRRS